MKNITFLLIAVFSMSSCAKVAVVTPDAHRLSNNHKLIAIDQPFVNIRGFGNNKSDKVFEVEELESQILQENMCKHLPLFLKEEGMYVKVMTYEETFDKFEATTEPLQELNLLGVSQVLEVDAVLQSRYELDGPISQNQAITDLIGSSIIFGSVNIGSSFGSNDRVNVIYELYDRKTNKIIWTKEFNISSSFKSHEGLIKRMMSKAVKDLPYRRRSR